MKYFLLIPCLLFLNIKPVVSQIVKDVTFDPIKGEYQIQYRVDDIIQKGFFVPGNGVKPAVNASVKYDAGLERFIYSFEIKNEEQAFHPLYAIELVINTGVNNIKSPDKNWSGRYIQWMSKIKWSKTKGFIPGISSGELKKGFQFTSQYSPGILNGMASSLTDIYFPEIDEEMPPEISTVIDSLRLRNRYVEFKTIGPRKLPEDITNPVLLDTLHSYLAFSCDTTWIENRGICRSLQAKLDNVDRQLERGNNRPAAGSLQALLNQLDALKEKQISSEAYALLYYNGQYLLERLTE